MAQRISKTRCLFAIALAVSLLSTGVLIGYEVVPLLLPRSDERRPRNEMQDYHTVAAADNKIAQSVEFSSQHYRNLNVRTSQANSAVINSSSKTLETSEIVDLKKRSLEHCNILKHSTYAEGSFSPLYKLSAIAVIVRHGERTPLSRFLNHTLPEQLSCNFSYITGNQNFRLGSQVRANDSGKSEGNLPWHNIYSYTRACGVGQLTSRGFLQMVQLGKQFRDAYSNHKDFSQSVFNSSSQIYVRTTGYKRTIQSAYGFLIGLLQNEDFGNVKFVIDEDINFCSNSIGKFSCSCPSVKVLAQIIEREYRQISAATRSQERLIKAKLAAIFKVSAGRIPFNGAMLEIFMSRVCLGLDPPCRMNSSAKRHCVTWSLINKMWDFADKLGERSLNSSTEERLNLLTTYPLLHDIVHRFLYVTNYSTLKNSTRFFLFSGHDKAIIAVMKALRIHNGRWPPFAARITFELFSRHDEKHYIRVLYNGKDLTKRVRFCGNLANSSNNFCPFENFVYFILYEVYRQLKVKNYSELCQRI